MSRHEFLYSNKTLFWGFFLFPNFPLFIILKRLEFIFIRFFEHNLIVFFQNSSHSTADISKRAGQFSVKIPNYRQKMRKPLQIWLIFSLQDVQERKIYKNGKKNSLMSVRWVLKVTHVFGPKSVIFKHFHFSFGKTHQKNVKFCLNGAYVG
jgi:hypothetical protein